MSNLPSMRACSPTTVSSVMECDRPFSGAGATTTGFCGAVFLSLNIKSSFRVRRNCALKSSCQAELMGTGGSHGGGGGRERIQIQRHLAAGHVPQRIDGVTMHANFEVHVRTGGQSAATHGPNDIAHVDLIARMHKGSAA